MAQAAGCMRWGHLLRWQRLGGEQGFVSLAAFYLVDGRELRLLFGVCVSSGGVNQPVL